MLRFTLQGRPKSGPEDKFRLTPVAPRLQELLGKPVSIEIFPSSQRYLDAQLTH